MRKAIQSSSGSWNLRHSKHNHSIWVREGRWFRIEIMMIEQQETKSWQEYFLFIFPFAHFSTSSLLYISAHCCCWIEFCSVFREGFKFPLQQKKVLICRMIQFNDEWHPSSFSHHLHKLSPKVWHFHLNDFGRSGKVYVSLLLFGSFSDSLSEKLTVSPMITDYRWTYSFHMNTKPESSDEIFCVRDGWMHWKLHLECSKIFPRQSKKFSPLDFSHSRLVFRRLKEKFM